MMARMKRLPTPTLILMLGVLQAAAWPQTTLKVSVDLVNVLFTVTDRHGRLVPGLTQADFAVEEDGRKQDILHFAADNELPLTLAMLIDTSSSVQPVFSAEKRTAKAFLRSVLRPKDLALVIGFDRTVTLMEDFTNSTRRLGNAIDDLEIGPGTSLHDAVYLAAREKLRFEAGRKAIILLSDGDDTTSKLGLSEALVAAHQTDTVIYSIYNSTSRRDGDPGTLRKLSEETGGGVFYIDSDRDFEEIFDQIGRELRSQYSLGYQSTNTERDGKFRRIKIVPRDGSLRVQARRGYYAARGL